MACLFPGVALVVGAASGIGRAVAVSFAQEGCRRIAIADRDLPGLQESARLIRALDIKEQPAVLVLTADVLKEEDIAQMVRSTVEKWSRIDYAVNAAGILGNGKSTTLSTLDEFDRINGVNYRGCWMCSRAEIAQMMQQEPLPTHDGRPGNRGSVVHIASQLGLVGREKSAVYCASKSAVVAMTRADAIDYAAERIRINCVCPGLVATPMLAAFDAATLQRDYAVAPMNRPGTPQEIADAVLFLASSKATFVQGTAFVVDGGYTIN